MKINADMNMIKRTISGFVIGWISFFCLLYGGLPMMIIIAIVSTIGSLEFVKILNHKGFYPFKSVIVSINLAVLFAVSIKLPQFLPLIFYIGSAFAFLAVIFRGRQPYIANAATTALGFMYLGWLPAHIIMVRQLDSHTLGFVNFEINNGIIFLLMYFFGVLATDIGAFYFGKKFGKRKLAPVISPNKTVEGSIGGCISTVVVCLVIAIFANLNKGWNFNISIVHTIILAIIITVFAQLGDLAESLLKRDAGVKDSGASIPGHGGFLDRTDGYIFAAPAVFYYVNYFILHNNYGLITRILEILNVAK